MLGTTLAGRYRIVRLLGRGGMGSVYEAHDATTGSRVAVKVVTAEVLEDAVLIGRFSREARAAMAIETPHVARVLDAGHDPERRLPFLVMEYLQGEDLRSVLRRVGPLPTDAALRMAAQAAAGLAEAHARRIVHRDIKPANLFLAEGPGGERTVKIVDFGIAKLQADPEKASAEVTNLTRTGSMLGSPLYMSPEQARGHRDIDERADVWSLGVVLFQALSGRTPHPGDTPLGDLIVAICTEPPPPVQSVAPWVPAEAAAIVQRALQLDPGSRFQTAAEMRAALLALLPGGATLREEMLRPLSPAERAQVAPALPQASAAPPPSPSQLGWGAQVPPPSPSGSGWSTASASSVPQVHPGWANAPSQPPPSAPDQASSLAGLGAAAPATPRRSRRAVAIAVGAVLLLAATGAGFYLLRRATADTPADERRPGVEEPPPGATAQARTVRVAVLPRGAEVEIDGAKAAPVDGVIEIRGALGSIHRVRVRADGAEVLREVVITEQGAMPPAVDVNAAPGAPATGSGSAQPAPTPGGAGPANRPAPGGAASSSASPQPSGTIWLKR